MKKIYLLPIGIAMSIGFYAFKQSTSIQIKDFHGKLLSGSGAPAGKTGAPGEGTCMDCHNISTLVNNSTENQLTLLDPSLNPVTEYTPGVTYSVGLVQVTNVGGTGGFEATVLDATNAMAGSFAAIAGTQTVTGSGRTYVTHVNNSSSQWGWSWTAPATDVGTVTFYVASNKSNGSASHAGDVINLTQFTFDAAVTSGVGIEELETNKTDFNAVYVSASNELKLSFSKEEVGKMAINLVDMNGKSVYAQKLGQSVSGENSKSIQLPAAVKSGVYFVNFFVDNTPMSAKVMINK